MSSLKKLCTAMIIIISLPSKSIYSLSDIDMKVCNAFKNESDKKSCIIEFEKNYKDVAKDISLNVVIPWVSLPRFDDWSNLMFIKLGIIEINKNSDIYNTIKKGMTDNCLFKIGSISTLL